MQFDEPCDERALVCYVNWQVIGIGTEVWNEPQRPGKDGVSIRRARGRAALFFKILKNPTVAGGCETTSGHCIFLYSEKSSDLDKSRARA